MARGRLSSSQGSQSHLHNQKITSFFHSLSSSQPQPSSSQPSMPSSSQTQQPLASQGTPGPSSSQRRPPPASQPAMAPSARPKSKPQASASQHDPSPSMARAAPQNNETKAPHKRKSRELEAQEVELSAQHTSDATSHISISSNSAVRVHSPKKPKLPSVIVISDSSDRDHAVSRASPSSPKGMKSRAKARPSSGVTFESASTSNPKTKARSNAKAASISATTTPSTAKTTIKKRPKFNPDDSMSFSPLLAEKKRKRNLLKDFDSPDESSEDDLFDGRPDVFSEAALRVPKILTREDLLPPELLKSGNSKGKGKGKEKAMTSVVKVVNREASAHSTSSSKRRRVTPPSPLSSLPPSPHRSSQALPDVTPAHGEDQGPVSTPAPVATLATLDVKLESASPKLTSNQKRKHRAPASSGNEADAEEIPSSQSDEQELTLPKAITKDPKEVKARVDQWRHSSASGACASVGEAEYEPLSAVSEGETTLSDGDMLVSSLLSPKDADETQTNTMSSPDPVPDSFPASEFGNNDASMDVDTDFDVGFPAIPEPHTPEPQLVAGMDEETFVDEGADHEDAEEVSQQLKMVPQSSSVSSLSSLPSTPNDTRPATPATPPPGQTSQPEIADAGASPFKTAPCESFAEIFRTVTPPPPSDQDVLPPSPVKLDSKAKTQSLIDQIKAQALANVARDDSDEEKKERKFDSGESESDSDSDLEFKYDFTKRRLQLSQASSKASSPLSSQPSSQPEDGPSHYSLRQRNSPTENASAGPSGYSLMLTQAKEKPKPKDDPLSAMLRQKQREDRRGVGMEARREAEEILAREEARGFVPSKAKGKAAVKGKGKSKVQVKREGKGKGKLHEEMNEEDAWADDSLAFDDTMNDNDDDGVDERVRDRALEMLEAKDGGSAVRKILQDDQKEKNVVLVERGIHLFDDGNDGVVKKEEDGDEMNVDSAPEYIPELPFEDEQIERDPVLSLLRGAVKMDTSRLCTFLTPALLLRVKDMFLANLVPWLFHLAMSPSGQLVGERSTECLLALAQYSRPASSFSGLVVATFLRFGARRSALEHLGLELPADPSVAAIDAERRSELLARAVEIVKCFAQNNLILTEDLHNTIMSLLPIAMDPATSSELLAEVMVTADILGTCIPSSADGVFLQEVELCYRVLAYAVDMAPPNRALLLSAFCGGSLQTARISRWLARRLLFVDAAETYCDHPSLNPLVELLTPDTGSETIFDVMGNARKPTFYEDLAAHVEMLNVCFNDIDGYVLLDEQEKLLQPPPDVTMSPSKDKPATTLDRVCMALQRLHGRIVDTNSVQLARTRAKAAMQQLSMRIHFTRVATNPKKSAARGGLKVWFKPVKA